jgi:hypothetical protein
MLDLLRFAFALLPLAAYTNVLGLLRLRSCPTVVGGAMDFVLLGLAASGLMAIGPIELFFPRAAYALLGGWVWVILLALYFFVILLIALNTSPKLVVYGLDAAELKFAIRELLSEHQLSSEWLGDVVQIPELGVRAYIERAGRASISQIHSNGRDQNLTGWLSLERLLVQKLSKQRIDQRKQATALLLTSFLLFGLAIFFVSADLPRLGEVMSNLFHGD